MKPKVTIGVCVRNCEEFVGETIKSVSDQDFPSELMEVIFVDDGSQDNTLAIIEKCTSSMRIPSKVFHTSWKGIGHARNMVIDSAVGDYIVWVDGDMILSRDFVRKLVDLMDKHPEIAVAKGKQALEPGGNLLGTLETYGRAATRMVNYESDKSYAKSLGTGGSIYRVEVLRKVGKFDDKFRGYGEDFDLELRIRGAGYSFSTVASEFKDYERYGLSWKDLWSRYLLRGYYSHYFIHKNKGLIKHYKTLPPVAFLSGFVYASKLFKATHQKVVFLLPFQYGFKMVAWYFGFLKSHFNSYQPQ